MPQRAGTMARVEAILFDLFRRWGFRRIVTPSLEFLDVVALGVGDELKEAAFKLGDRVSGRVLAVRPDLTPQVARMVATRMRDHPLPLRLCYGGTVLRDEPGRPREIYQAGVELIGLEAAEADAEMISLATECLRAFAICDFKIDVGQMGFSRAILRRASLPPAAERAVRLALAKKDISGLGQALKGVSCPPETADLLITLPTLFGGEEVVAKAEAVCREPAALDALENLRQVIDIVKIYGLEEYMSIDLGEMRGFDYHNGVVFEGFVSGQGFPLLGGGRYDGLIGKYGYDCPATGFALNLEMLVETLETRGLLPAEGRVDFLLINLRGEKGEALKLARSLREAGFGVARDIIKRDVEGSTEYARRSQIDGVIILDDGKILLRHLPSGEERKLNIAGLLKEVKRWPRSSGRG